MSTGRVANTFLFLFLFGIFVPVISCGQKSRDNKDSSLIEKLKSEAVYNDDFVRNTFYTWTTAEQIDELRKTKKLLTKSKSETKGYSLFDVALRDSSYKNDTLVKILLEEQFTKKRFAWTNSWATVMGWEGETYGDHLVKIMLDSSAIIGSFHREGDKPLQFFDMKGKKLATEYVVRNKNRIAAIFHIGSYRGKRTEAKWKGSYFDGKVFIKETDIPFREFVIVNDAMIKNWSYGTNEIKKKIESDIIVLNLLKKRKSSNQKMYRQWSGPPVDQIYRNENTPHDVSILFNASKCFDNDFYMLNSKKIQSVIAKLQLVLAQQLPALTK